MPIGLPDKSLEIGDIGRLADWAELACVTREEQVFSTGDIADAVHNSLLLQEEAEESDESHWELAERYAEDALVELKRRRRALGEGYPFSFGKYHAAATGAWGENLSFTALLIADIGRFFSRASVRFDPGSPFPRLFEKIVEASLRSLFRGCSIRFGWPPDPGWPRGIADRVRRLAEEFGLQADNPEKKTEGREKDIGLDVAARLRIGDEGPGSGVLLVQCATGANWKVKQGEPSLSEWARLVDWRSTLVRGVAFPWRRTNEKRIAQWSVRMNAVLFDRLRLMSSGNPDRHLDSSAAGELAEWCHERINELRG